MTYEPHATFIQRRNSGIVGRLPYERMPTRKIFAVAQKNPATVAMETRMLSAICDIGGSATRIRTNIVNGPNTGAIERPTTNGESGFVIRTMIRNHGNIIDIVIGAMSCCASLSELQIAPPTAYTQTYVR